MSLTQTLRDNCEELGSKIELINNSNELGDNPPQSNTQNYFLRVGKPGKLFLQPNYTAFTKTSLGSIPSKIEKTLLKTETNIPLTTSINNSLSLNSSETKFNSTTANESILSYKDPKNYSKSFSSKGYGNGFISKVERFNKYLKEYTPGPGDYSPDRLFTVENDIKKSTFGKSLFLDRANRSLSLLNPVSPSEQKFFTSQEKEYIIKKKERELNKDKNKELDKENNKIDNKKGNYFFESNTNRFSGGLFTITNKYPGPGKYFPNMDYIIPNKSKNSPNFIYPAQRVINPIKFYRLNTNDGKELGFQIKNKVKNAKVATFWRGMHHLGNTYDFGETINEGDKKLIKKKTLNNENIVTMPDLELLKKIRKNKFYRSNKKNLPSISEEKTLNSNIIRRIFKFKKKDLFGLASPRWDQGFFHDNETHFQVPGPAYYEPRIISNKKSFNLNKNDFIYTNSVPYQAVNGSMIPSNEF